MPRFVILEHDFPSLHWDLMLEANEVLRTWRLDAPPQLGVSIAAEAIPDHRLLYLVYEGPISGNRGRVVRWDHGTFVELIHEEDHLIARLEGQRLRGILELTYENGDLWKGGFRGAATPPED